MFDSIIIGSGPAGMSAAIYGARNNLNIAIVESSAPGGQMINTSTIENYPGIKKIDGVSLSLAMYEQVNELNVQFIFGNAIAIHKNNYFEVQVDNQKYQSKTVIVATGAKNRKLNIPGESKYVCNCSSQLSSVLLPVRSPRASDSPLAPQPRRHLTVPPKGS